MILCERGIRTFETATRNTLDIAAVPCTEGGVASSLSSWIQVTRRVPVSWSPRWPVPPSPSEPDGLLVEVHPAPEEALSDGGQSLTFNEFRSMMDDLQPYIALQREARRFEPQNVTRSGMSRSMPIVRCCPACSFLLEPV